MKTIIIGLGNPILTDDGVGVKVANQVAESLAGDVDNGIKVTEASVGGLRLMEMMVGYDRAIIVDAITSPNAKELGAIQRMTVGDLRAMCPTQHSASAHDTNLVTALDAGNCLGLKLPREIIIFAVTVENITEFSEISTPAVDAAIPKAAAAVLNEISQV